MEINMDIIIYFLAVPASFFLGFGLFKLIIHYLPKFIVTSSQTLSHNIIQEANNQRSVIFNQKIDLSKYQLSAKEHDADLNSLYQDLKDQQSILDKKHQQLTQHSFRLKKVQANNLQIKQSISEKNSNVVDLQQKLNDTRSKLVVSLAELSKTDLEKQKNILSKDLINHHKLEHLKNLKLIETELNDRALKKAQLALSQVNSRYAPDFVWPSSSSSVPEINPGQIEDIIKANPSLVEHLNHLSQCDVTLIPGPNEHIEKIKFAGGFGIYREAIKLAFIDQLKCSLFSINKLDQNYHSYVKKLNSKAMQLGYRAVTELKLDGVDQSLQYLIGALNWRTSYQQNQWLHTMEVAVLAGMLAQELDIDPDHAKRSGLLHDIGKALDYRIEGSHAIISGDYADRYGESKIVCDTVMSHHSDLVMETPQAFTLMAADTLSGARPGARINIEEGYQIRLSNITEAIKKFYGVQNLAIMNGAREVHVSVNHHTVSEKRAKDLAKEIAEKIQTDVSYPAQIKIQVERIIESHSVA